MFSIRKNPKSELIDLLTLEPRKHDKYTKQWYVSVKNQEKIITTLGLQADVLNFLLQNACIKRNVAYQIESGLYPDTKKTEYKNTQSLLGHLFALRCWRVIEYLITKDLINTKTTLERPIQEINKKPISILTLLLKEAPSLFSLLHKKVRLKSNEETLIYIDIETATIVRNPSLIKFSVLKPEKGPQPASASPPKAKTPSF